MHWYQIGATSVRILPLALTLALLQPHAVQAADDFAARCSAMKQYRQGDLIVTAAEAIAAGPAPAPPFSQPGGQAEARARLPAHCMVQAAFEQRIGVAGVPYAIRMELRLPEDWNGRFYFQGGGGMNGFVAAAVGDGTSSSSAYPPALARGFAVVTTDTGHAAATPADASFARDQQSKLNYAYAAVGKVTLRAKDMIAALAGRPPERSYFAGCSNGGREALLMAQREPTLFDGVLAGDPAFNLRDAAVLSQFSGAVYDEAARHDAASGGVAARLVSPAEGALIRTALLDKCDALDGARDGLIFNQAMCHFDIHSLACKPGQKAGSCLAPAKVAAIARAFEGPLGADGKPRFAPWSWDTGVFTPDWLTWQTGLPLPDGSVMNMLRNLVQSSLTQFFAFPPIDPATLTGTAADVPRLLGATEETAALTVATATDFTTFAARGGKLMITDGWSDPIFSPHDLIAWYGRVSADMQQVSGQPATNFARLFMVPGMAHCAGGQALDDMDALSALVDWVEKDKAPDALIATGRAMPGVSRPICAWPKVARYSGSGPIEQAASFRCE